MAQHKAHETLTTNTNEPTVTETFKSFRSSRETTRQELIDYLDAIISSESASASAKTAAETQKQGGMAAFIDAEHALDPYYAQALGVQINDLYIAQPDSGEQALNITETLVRSNSIDLIVVDSVAALTPQAEIDGEIGDSSVGLQARLMSQAMRKLTAICNKSRCSIVFINQLREKVGVIYGSPEVTTGGKALKFY